MKTRVYLSAMTVLLAQQAVFAQSAMRPIAIDGDAAYGFLGSSLDIGFNDQSGTNSLPQLVSDGTVTFRARVVSSLGGVTSPDAWWVTREGSYQVAAHIGGAPGLLQIPASQFGRFYAHPDAQRMVIDRSGPRFFEWFDLRWVNGLGSGGWPVTVNGASWFIGQMDRSNTIMPRADMVVFAARLPAPVGSPVPGQSNGFIAGWQGAYTSLFVTGQPFPGAAGQYIVTADAIDGGSDTALGRSLRMNASGQWAARVAIGGTGSTSLNNTAVVRGALGTPGWSVLLRAGDIAPGWTGGLAQRIDQLSRPSINSQGYLAVIARLVPASGTGTSVFALYVDRGSGLELLARTGTEVVPAAPTTPAPVITFPWSTSGAVGPTPQTLPPPVIGEDGTVAFMATTTRGEGVFALRNGAVHEVVRRDMVLPRTGGRMVVRPFISDGQQDGATGLGIAANGDVVFSVPATGNYDPRLAQSSFQTHAVLAWREGRGVRVVSCQGMMLDEFPGSRSRIVTSGLLADGNNHDGVPTGVGHGSGAAVQVGCTRFLTETTPAFQAVLLADLDTFACGVADIAGPGASPTPDGELDNNDFIVMIDRFFSGDLRVDYGKAGGEVGFDDRLDNNDFVAFITLYFTGCD